VKGLAVNRLDGHQVGAHSAWSYADSTEMATNLENWSTDQNPACSASVGSGALR